jgi:AcrR family transcriptional regulator
MTKPKRNNYGQVQGRKGRSTEDRILKVTAELMEKRPIRELKILEIGSLAGVATSTFYIYFDTVEEAALAVVERLQQATPEVMSILAREWTRDTVAENAKAFVQAYFAYWDRHHALLRVRNLLADEGDKRFLDVRRRSTEPIHFAMQEKIRHFQAIDTRAPALDPPSTVSVLLAMLERTAAIIRQPSAHQATRPRQVECAAFFVANALIGPQEALVRTRRAGTGEDGPPRRATPKARTSPRPPEPAAPEPDAA